ncbi:MAG TPA: GIY-YIG nuclease family protein [Rubricoccaceae bacterium]|jgi:hypothetical protein
MNSQQKALLKREYKEQARPRGVFRVYSTVTAQNWVDASPTLDTIQNRVWFDLRMGSHRNRELQRAWNEGGAEAMVFEVVEVFPEEASGYTLGGLMKERKAHWMAEFHAAPCL